MTAQCLYWEASRIYKSASIYNRQPILHVGVVNMKELVLLCTVAVFFIAGYFVMDKLDHFFEENLRLPEHEEAFSTGDKKEEI